MRSGHLAAGSRRSAPGLWARRLNWTDYSRPTTTPDVLAHDPGLQRVYVAAEDGTLVVIQACDPPRKVA